ncbi:Glyoxalase/Bleomycin resistance protein/Dihydroxybiphenyl dioxygenase [Xylogone sp. PMI_703]|nr:Glyoxalase/Bleomycin resistance protein/Dihydroxybiphenyl dioxygenase [Xylogone sp. PMI_703]
MAVDFDKQFTKVISPKKLAHVVLRTGRFKEMVSFYKTFLGAEAAYENDFLSFLAYDGEHHRIAIVDIPGIDTGPKRREFPGLEHVAFSFSTLDDLCLAYRQRKAKGILPIWCVNHGPTTSMYYQDPDGNQIEAQVDNFDSVEGANEFFSSREFAENPIGVDFDPEELITKLKENVDHKILKRRLDIGPRGIDSVPSPPPITT